MTIDKPNRLLAPTTPRLSAQQWADRGNALLAGTLATSKGDYLTPRADVRWVVRDGKCVIECCEPSRKSLTNG